jgi:hypothetical protein
MIREAPLSPDTEDNLELFCAASRAPLDEPAESVSLVDMPDLGRRTPSETKRDESTYNGNPISVSRWEIQGAM